MIHRNTYIENLKENIIKIFVKLLSLILSLTCHRDDNF